MNRRLLYLFIICSTLSIASTKAIDNKISLNKKILNKKKSQQKNTKTKIRTLALQIKKQEKEYQRIEKSLEKINNNIFLNKVKLERAKENIVKIEQDSKQVKKQKQETEESIVNTIIEKYSATLGIQLATKQDKQALIDKEIYSILLEESKENILDLDVKYLKLSNTKRKNEDKTVKYAQYIKGQEEEKIRFKNLKIKKQEAIKKLSSQHKAYQKKLKDIIKKQAKLANLLSSLNILKTKELKKEKQRRISKKKKALLAKRKKEKLEKKKKALLKKNKKEQSSKKIKILSKKKLEKEIDLEVRNIGSSTKGIKISKYNGIKTMAPLKSYKIIKKFGKYFDPVYKIELFHEAISLKPKKPNAKVYSVLKGKIVYVKKNAGTLENVVIVKHKGGLHTVYSNLDKIAPTLKTNKWIKKGSVVGRVSDKLMFQATKNGKYINPQKLFR